VVEVRYVAFDFERLEPRPPCVLHREIRPPTPRSEATVYEVTKGNIAKQAATALVALLIVFAVSSNDGIQRRTVQRRRECQSTLIERQSIFEFPRLKPTV